MKRHCLALAFLLLIAPQIGYGQAIKQVAEGWLGIVGNWEVDKKGTVSGLGYIKYDKQQPLDFRFKASIRIEEVRQGAEGGPRIEIIFRRNPEEEWPSYLLRIRPNDIALIKWDQGKKTLDEVKVDVPLGQWIKLDLQMKGGKMQARIGKRIRLQAADPEPITHDIFLIAVIGLKAQLKDLDLSGRK